MSISLTYLIFYDYNNVKCKTQVFPLDNKTKNLNKYNLFWSNRSDFKQIEIIIFILRRGTYIEVILNRDLNAKGANVVGRTKAIIRKCAFNNLKTCF